MVAETLPRALYRLSGSVPVEIIGGGTNNRRIIVQKANCAVARTAEQSSNHSCVMGMIYKKGCWASVSRLWSLTVRFPSRWLSTDSAESVLGCEHPLVDLDGHAVLLHCRSQAGSFLLGLRSYASNVVRTGYESSTGRAIRFAVPVRAVTECLTGQFLVTVWAVFSGRASYTARFMSCADLGSPFSRSLFGHTSW